MSRPIRVLILISNLEYGGAQRQVIELVNKIDKSKVELYICSLSGYIPLSSQINNANYKVHIIEKRFKFDFTVIPRLVWLLKKLKIDVIHSYLFDAEIAARISGRLAKTKAIVGSERNTNYHLKKRQLLAYSLTKNWVDLIIANSNAGAKFNSNILKQDISKYKIIHNGVNIERFKPSDKKTAQTKCGVSNGQQVIGMFASFKQQKNHPLLFKAAKNVIQKFPNTIFLFVGDMLYSGMHGSDEYMKDMDSLVDELGIRANCLFLGNIDHVETIYSACDITVLPSLFEGTPNVILESMACEVPVIATDVSDNSLIVRDGETGYIINTDANLLANKIKVLLRDQSTVERMGKRAREWVANEFSTMALARKTESAYLALVKSS